MTDLGSYITNEYGLLTLIFSYLPSKELLNAANVCKEWREVALRILSQNNVPKCYNKRNCPTWDSFNDKIHPKAILHFSLSSASTESAVYAKNTELIYNLDKTYSVRGNSVYCIINNSWYISSEVKNGKVSVFNERAKTSESLLLLPEMRGVDIDIFSVETHYLNSANIIANINSDIVSRSKCFVLLANPIRNSLHLVHKFVTSFPNPQTLVMAGGIALELFRIDIGSAAYSEDSFKIVSRIGILGMSIGGENVTAHSDLHNLSTDINVFLENFAKKVGPKPKGYERIALMFVCVDRSLVVHDDETNHFSKYFPDVPVYGFGSLGEYCIRNPMIDDNIEHKRKKVKSGNVTSYKTVSNLKFSHEQCTAYLVITFKKV